MKLVLFVEGQTEKEALRFFFKRWLDPRLRQPIALPPVRFEGSADYRRKFATRARLDLQQGHIIGIVGLLDLYGSGLEYPVALSQDERYAWAKQMLQAEVGDTRFCQHFAVHETEAWLLSDPAIFPSLIARSFPGTVSDPESIDFQEPPSKLLRRLYREKLGKDYKKVSDGADLFGKLDPSIACSKCPHLKLLLDDMLRLATAAL